MAEREERDRVVRAENEEGKDEVEAHTVREVVREQKTEAPDEDRFEKDDDVEAHRKQ